MRRTVPQKINYKDIIPFENKPIEEKEKELQELLEKNAHLIEWEDID